jgi:putative Mg2+ transporter-C (MgtC) family protein
VRGLTTAATLWVAAAIGMATGAGYYSGALIGTVLTVLALGPLRIMAYPVFERMRPEERTMIIELRHDATAAQLIDALEREHARVEHFRIESDRDHRVVTVTLDTPSGNMLTHVADLEFVQGVEWNR